MIFHWKISLIAMHYPLVGENPPASPTAQATFSPAWIFSVTSCRTGPEETLVKVSTMLLDDRALMFIRRKLIRW